MQTLPRLKQVLRGTIENMPVNRLLKTEKAMPQLRLPPASPNEVYGETPSQFLYGLIANRAGSLTGARQSTYFLVDKLPCLGHGWYELQICIRAASRLNG